MPWKPWLGAVPDEGGTHFRVWAPRADSLSVKIVSGPTLALRREAEGYFTGRADGVRAGARYFYRFPDGRERPDPASLLQPALVHGPSEVVDLQAVRPRSPRAGLPLPGLVFCEIHLGTFSPSGDADGAARFLTALAESLYTAVEVMPIAAFPGTRNWGYDGVAPFSAHAAYGGLVRRAAPRRGPRHLRRWAPAHPAGDRRGGARRRRPLHRGERSQRPAAGRAVRPRRLLGRRFPSRAARALTGESQGYYGDYQDPMPKLVAALKRGWFYQGQYKPGFGRPHGAPAAHLPGRRFVVYAQNHDQPEIAPAASGSPS